jgi:N-acetylmuramoyl-L-alanine amidase
VNRLQATFFTFWTATVISAWAAAETEHLSPLAQKPDWSKLKRFNETITAQEFKRLLNDVYLTNGNSKEWIDISETRAFVRTSEGPDAPSVTLLFAKSEQVAKPVPRYWRPPTVLASQGPNKPLYGAKIAIDPGHLGGSWSRMEERWFKVGDSAPVAEGDLALRVAQLLAPKLRALGAQVNLIRTSSEPTTNVRPSDLRSVALKFLKEQGVTDIREDFMGPTDPRRESSIRWQSERLFYRVAEIRSRGKLVNEKLKPDMVVCIHLNAEEWGDPTRPTLVDANHVHLLVNGAYEPSELQLEDVRFEMLRKLLDRSSSAEIALAEHVAASLAIATGLPAYQYHGDNTHRLGKSGYVWARNLLANRIYQCPVLYTEVYVMNNKTVLRRIELGDYEGLREVDDKMRKSIYREYADALIDGITLAFNDAVKSTPRAVTSDTASQPGNLNYR